MSEILKFSDLADMFGVDARLPKMGPGGVPEGPAPMVHSNVWGQEKGRQALDYLKTKYSPGDYFEYDGHADCWLMLAILYELRKCSLNSYIGVFGKTLHIEAFNAGGGKKDGQPVYFDVEEKDGAVLLNANLDPDKGPFDMAFGEISVPEIPAGKDIYVRLNGRHLLFVFPVSLTYGEQARAIYMDYAGQCVCSVSNTPEVKVGDVVDCPF